MIVVENCAVSAAIIRENVEDVTKNIFCVNDAEKALFYIGAFRPKVLLIDIELPGINGLEIIRTLKITYQINLDDIIILTGYSKYQQQAENLGVKNYYEKPTSFNRINENIKKILTV